jgi:hypothetical protein
MAHQQLPLNNSLGVSGNNRHLVVDPSTNNRYGEMSIQQETASVGYPELNIVGHGQQQNLKQLPHSNSFNNFPPPPYPHTVSFVLIMFIVISFTEIIVQSPQFAKRKRVHFTRHFRKIYTTSPKPSTNLSINLLGTRLQN